MSILSQSNAHIYLDIGHPEWLTPQQVKKYLSFYDLSNIRGVSINTSNYYTTEECIEFGDKINELVNLQDLHTNKSKQAMYWADIGKYH